ncbi:MAG: class I SAM-dependent methyltransferase [Planctomycetes bacterium]|nr:class I SAM-dependent methyltransferase [Planctomycetota bacterium]
MRPELPDTPEIREAREDLCAFTGLPPEAVDRYFRREKGFRIRNEFDAVRPRDEAELRWFYRSCRTYVLSTACDAPWDKALRLARPGMRALDYGGGAGVNALALARRGCEVSYVDLGILTSDFVRFRARRHGLSIRVIEPFIPRDGALLLDPAGAVAGEYDLIVLKDTLEHIPDYERVLRHLIGRLAGEGWILENTPFKRRKRRRLEGLRRFFRRKGPTLHLPEGTPIASIMAGAGLTLVEPGVWQAPAASA